MEFHELKVRFRVLYLCSFSSILSNYGISLGSVKIGPSLSTQDLGNIYTASLKPVNSMKIFCTTTVSGMLHSHHSSNVINALISNRSQRPAIIGKYRAVILTSITVSFHLAAIQHTKLFGFAHYADHHFLSPTLAAPYSQHSAGGEMRC